MSYTSAPSVDVTREQMAILGHWGRIAALALIAFYLGLVVFLLSEVKADADQWARMVVILGSVEALVFAGAGALFGTEIQRPQIADAQARAATEKKRAEDVTAKTETLRKHAYKLTAEFEATKRQAERQPVAKAMGSQAAGSDEFLSIPKADLDHLLDLARAIEE